MRLSFSICPSSQQAMGVPKFLNALYRIMQDESKSIIGWSHGGKAFQIRDVPALEVLVLPKYFKHNKLSSFQRQLNYFGFRKWTKTQADVCTFSHPYFLKGKAENLPLITKKSAIPAAAGDSLNTEPLRLLGKRCRESETFSCKKIVKTDAGAFEPEEELELWETGLYDLCNTRYDQLVDYLLSDDDLLGEFELFNTLSTCFSDPVVSCHCNN